MTVQFTWRRLVWVATALHVTTVITAALHAAAVPGVQTPGSRPQVPPAIPVTRTGEDIFRATCITCHHIDGTGSPRAVVGFDVPLPDFTDCAFATAESDADWHSVVHEGGRIRGLDRHMPAFGDALSKADIAKVVTYIRSFCTNKSWPQGDLNFPRPFFTEKAFPESETVFTTKSARPEGGREIEQAVEYERRIGPRGQIVAEIPVAFVREGEPWMRGLADVEVGYKHTLLANLRTGTIVSGGAIVTLPTGDETKGLGGGTFVYEPVVYAGQRLPGMSFIQGQAGLEFPQASDDERSAYVNMAVGKSFAADRGFGRLWTPIFEVLWARPFGGESTWDVVPGIQISLSKIQHVRAAVGLRMPVNQRAERPNEFVFYLLWDWADGGFLQFWK